MYPLITRSEVERLLAPFGCVFLGEWCPGSERWVTDWGHELGLSPEIDTEKLYCRFAIERAVEELTALRPGPRNRP